MQPILLDKAIKKTKISVIIPTLNEELYLGECIRYARERSRFPLEIIVVDAGSMDATCEIARKAADQLLVHPEFTGKKYASLNAGAAMACGDLLLFLDADTLLPQDFDTRIVDTHENGFIGGAFQLQFDQTSFLLRIITLFNALRYRITHRFFGDQAIFCSSSGFRQVGGFPAIDIMEASRLCKRLKKHGKLKLISTPVVTSSRRFQQGGVIRVFLQDFKIYVKDLLGLSLQKESEEYWTFNKR